MFSKNTFQKFIAMVFILATLLSSVQAPNVLAQGQDGLKRQVNAGSGRVSFIGPESGRAVSAFRALGTFFRPQDPGMALAKRYAPEFGVRDPERNLTEMKKNTLDDGRVSIRYQQEYQGVPVMGGELIVNTNENGDLYSMNGEVSPDLSLQTQPEIDSAQAAQTALEAVAKWYEKTSADFVASTPELWIYDESLLKPSDRPVELVWRMEVTPKDNAMPVRELVLVNAERGNISLHFNQIDNAWEMPTNVADTSVELSTSKQVANGGQAATNSTVNPIPALAPATWYVATTGNDLNSCSAPGSPCATINGAIGKAASGDMIKVAVGTYTGTGSFVVSINNNNILSGGWNNTFSIQSGFSVVDGQNERSGIFSGGSIIDHFIITNGYSSGPAGGIANYGELTLNNSVVMNNDNAGGAGGGIFSAGNLTLNNSTVRGNFANSAGGILMYSAYGLTLNNSTITENRAAILGGGIVLSSGSGGSTQVTTINNSTIANNSAPQAGGIDIGGFNPSTVTIKNSIIANNSAYITGPDCLGRIDVLDHSIIGNSSNCTIPSGNGNRLNIKSGISAYPVGVLGYHALHPGSPAIDAGANCLPTDQRGVSRPQGSACDIGSYEFTAPGAAASFGISFGSNQRVGSLFSFPKPLAVYIVDNVGSPVSGVNVTFTAPVSGASGIFADSGTNTTTVITNDNGLAITSIFTANSQLGTYNVVATASGLTGSVNFTLTNATWYVATTGDDANDCASPFTACATVNGAVGKAGSGDVVEVTNGTYTGSGSEVVLVDKNITLSGGWNSTFTNQNGATAIDGENIRSGITINSPTATVNLSFFIIKNSNGHGIDNKGNLTITNSSIYNNVASSSGNGGGIFNTGTLTLGNTTISSNSASNGGGIYSNGGSISLNNVTISNNTASNYGGGININAGTIEMKNSILAGNMASLYGPNCSGNITSLGYNILGNDKNCGFSPTNGDQKGTLTYPLSLHLTLFQDNGGPTFTYALFAGSPAIDHGNPATPGSGGGACEATDQRGVARPAGVRCDIGAYEGSLSWTPLPLVNTYTAGGTSSLPGTFLCDQTDPNCIPGDSYAKAAHKYAMGTYSFYATQFNRDSIDNGGMVIASTVQYCNPYYACPYGNAYWSGTQMVYGGAYGFTLADDVVAHELTHGVTQYESNLFSYYQSGAINESISDVFGEYYDQTNGEGNDAPNVKWLMGEDVSGMGAIRSLIYPPAFNDPDKMTSPLYRKDQSDSGGIHHNSGVNNKAAYLMVDGGTFNGKTVTTLSWEKVGAIYYEVNAYLLTSGSDYSDLYYALQQACSNLVGQHGITSADCVEVRDAIDAVEMNGQPAANFNVDAPLCDSNAPLLNEVFFDGMESGSNWWIHSDIGDKRWQYDSPYGPYAHSGLHSLYADDYPAAKTDTFAEMALGGTLDKGVHIPSNAFLRFSQAFGFEDNNGKNYDGGILEYLILGDGSSWKDAGPLFINNGYNGIIVSNFGNPLAGRSAFVNDSHGYIASRLNLQSLANKDVLFRWRMALDYDVYDMGWWLDDIQIYTCKAPTFSDVPFSHPRHDDIEILYANGYTGGCSTSPLLFCPELVMNRAQAAVFMMRGNFGGAYLPPSIPTHLFKDNWANAPWAETWAEAMFNNGLTGGCATSPSLLFCPYEQLTNAQAAVFGLRLKYGTLYTPPAASGTIFADMTDASFWATGWAEQAYAEGLIPSCGTSGGKPMFCPNALVNRGFGASIIVKAKNLTMP